MLVALRAGTSASTRAPLLRLARRAKERTYPELLRSQKCRLL